MYCGQCGKEIDNSSSFCANCGATVRNEEKFETEKKPPQKKQKIKSKNPWKIIIVIMAFALVVAIVLSVFLIGRNRKLEEKLEAKDRLAEILEESTDKPIVEFILEDYDSDGTYEAYAVAGQLKGESDDKKEYYDADVYFVNKTEAQLIQESISGKSNGTIKANDKIYISLENKFEDEAEGYSYIYTVDDNKPVESETSGKYHEVHQEDGKILAKEEINENFIEIEISDKVKDPDVGTVIDIITEAETEQTTASENSQSKREAGYYLGKKISDLLKDYGNKYINYTDAGGFIYYYEEDSVGFGIEYAKKDAPEDEQIIKSITSFSDARDIRIYKDYYAAMSYNELKEVNPAVSRPGYSEYSGSYSVSFTFDNKTFFYYWSEKPSDDTPSDNMFVKNWVD